MKAAIILIISLFSVLSYSQDLDRVYEADTIYFYGYDFSNFIVSDISNHNPSDYIFPWIVYINDMFRPKEYEKYLLSKVIPDFGFTNQVNEKLINNTSKSFRGIPDNNKDSKIKTYMLLYDSETSGSTHKDHINKEILDKDSIQKILNNYNLKQSDGIGLVALVRHIDKSKESTLIKFIFFDISSKDHIYTHTSLVEGGVGFGWTKHWGNSFRLNVENFLSEYYDNLYFKNRKIFKEKSKKLKKTRKMKRFDSSNF